LNPKKTDGIFTFIKERGGNDTTDKDACKTGLTICNNNTLFLIKSLCFIKINFMFLPLFKDTGRGKGKPRYELYGRIERKKQKSLIAMAKIKNTI
jgi:hypothetical protein